MQTNSMKTAPHSTRVHDIPPRRSPETDTWHADFDRPTGERLKRVHAIQEQVPHPFCILMLTGMQTRFFMDESAFISAGETLCRSKSEFAAFQYDAESSRYIHVPFAL